MKIQARPTFKYIPLIPVIGVTALIVVLVPILGLEGLWISAAVAIGTGIVYANRQSKDKKMHFDYQSLDWLLYGDVHLLERMLNIAESETRRALVTYSNKLSDRLRAKALEFLCKRRLIEVETHCDKNARLDLSLTGPKGKLVIHAKKSEDLKYRMEKKIKINQLPRGDFDCAMSLPIDTSKTDRMQQAKKSSEGQAIIWFEDRTLATVCLTDGPMPSQGLPVAKLPSFLDVVKMKKYPGTEIM